MFCRLFFQGFLNTQTSSGPSSRPIANFDPEGSIASFIYVITDEWTSMILFWSGVVFAVGIQSSMIKLYDIRQFDKVRKNTSR